jgi:hypothetical protein
MLRKRQFNGVPFDGILHQKAQRIDMGNTRGIVFDRPERHLVNTPVGQLEIWPGDWVVEFVAGRLYVVKNDDILAHAPARKWWKIW